ncbi:unnamed protein product [Psylliodes chrysocephalus]|uniref:Uncharacterized protein n=1 Tax=Psylliodes chrysocephalus TaxID=3402493 RepID=A0A9P0CTH0_9CUCU|nr:unnamed protein product [Psylliodes chrysocephala]
MDTPSIPSISEMEDSNKPVPRIFVNSQCSEKFSISESTDVKTSTSFIQKIMSNAKYMLTPRCNSLQPSIMSSEEPTRETDDCNRYGEYQGKVFREPSLINTKSRIKYTSSDYCMVEEDSNSKADTTTMTSKENSDSRVLERERYSIGSSSQNSGDVTSSLRAFNEIVSYKDNFSSGTAEQISPRRSRFPYADSESADFNGPFEQSEFFLRNDDTITNNIISTEGSMVFSKTTPVSQVTTGTSDMEQASRTPFSLLNSWFRSDKSDAKKNELDIPCRDECFCHTRSSSTSIPAIRRVSIGSAPSQNQTCYGIGDPHSCEPCPSKDKKSIASVSVSENDAEDELDELAPTCYSCGLKKQLVSTPSPAASIGEGWINGSDKVKTFHCESEVYPSRVLVCDDDSNPDCEDIGRYPEEIIPITGFKTSSLNVCSLRRIKSALSEKFAFSNRSIPRSLDRKIPGDKVAEKRKSEHHFDTSPVAKRVRSISDSRDQDNQCAFVGSPVLDASNFRVPTSQKKDSKGRTIGDMISDVNFREKNFRSQIQGFTNREKQYDNMRNSLQGEIAKCTFSHRGDKSNDDLERITRQLKNENNLLKSEMLEMKLDLKHTLEKVQGPMRLKLEAEKSRCEHLQKQLQKASQNMAVSEENYIRDMNNLKMQLCLACNNMDELESVNKKLKEEMNLMDGLCAKLEDDLMQQKLNEAETIRRLTTNKRSIGGDSPDAMMLCNCESNLHSIARKLSKTIKDCIPCPSCATGIPAELKDLTDMVDSRRDAMSFESIGEISRTDISCQSPPATEENSTQCMDLRNIGTVVSMCLISGPTLPPMSIDTSNRFPLSTNSLYVAPRDLDRKESGQFNLKLTSCSSETDQEAAMGKRSGSKSCHIKDSWTDPITIDPQIHLGRVRFEKHSPLVINTKDALNDPMMVDKNSSTTDKEIYNEATPPAGGGQLVIEPVEQHLPPMSQKISFKVHTALIKAIPSDLKKTIESDIRDMRPEIKTSRTESNDIDPVTAASKPEIQDIDVDNEVFEPRIIAVDLGITCDSKIDFGHNTSKMKILKRDPSEVTWQDDLSEYSNPSIPKDLDIEDGQASKKRQKMSIFEKVIQLDVPSDISNKKEPEPEQASSGESSRKVADPNENVIVENNDFPFLVDTKVEVCDNPPENLNITTSVTASGNLLVISEGPSGTIETILHYKDDGTIEVVTQIAELVGQSTDSLSSRKFYIPIPMKTDTTISEDISWEPGKKFSDQQEQEVSVSKQSQSTTLVSILSKESKKESVDKEKTSKSVSISETASDLHIENRKNFSGNTSSPLYIDRSQCCLICYQLDKASSAHHVPQVTASTSLSSTMINEKCGTGAVSKHNMLCGSSETTFIQQTVPLELQQKSAGEEVPKATCSSLTCPILTSCKNEDTYDGANELRSDEEVSCASDVCHQETCTLKLLKKDAHTDPMAENKDEGSMCDTILIEKSSKESSASETLEFACQANLQPLEQSCQVNESKEIGVITARTEKQSMTRENLFPDPPASLPSDVPCSPCINDSSKTDPNCQSMSMQPVGDAKFDINESARDKTSESRDECSCKKPCVCSTKKGPATEIPNECDVKDRRKRSSNQMSDCPCPGPCDCVKCSASICRDDKKRKIGAVDEKESSSFGSFKPQTKNAAEKQKQAQDRFGPYKTDFDVAYMDFMKPLPIAADNHPIGCECVDCICMPLVRQLAMTREFCVVEDHKQVYQVTTNTCQCPNSKKGSKIPVATKSGKPVKALACTCTGICTCSPCSDLEKRQGGGQKETGGKPVKQMTTEQLAELCDCGKEREALDEEDVTYEYVSR